MCYIQKILVIFLLLMVSGAIDGAVEGAYDHASRRVNAVPASRFETLAQAVVSDTTANRVILIDTPLRVEGVLTFPRDQSLKVTRGGMIMLSENARLIISGQFNAPLAQVFHGSGEVVFESHSISTAYPEWWGSGGDASQKAVNSFRKVHWRRGNIYKVCDITVPSNRELIVDGTLALANNSPDGAVIFRNADPDGGNRDITITGEGTLDGSKAGQSGSNTKHMLVSMTNCSDVDFSVKSVRGNYFPLAISSQYSGATIFINNSRKVRLHDSAGYDYGRECFELKDCSDSSMRNLSAFGGDDSWSGFQFSGENNVAENLYSENAGASGISFDCKNSTISNVTVKNNRYFNGINFGHPHAPAVNITGRRLVSHNSSQFGISVVNGSSNVKLVESEVYNSASHCYNVSANANNVSINNSVASECAGNGINVYQAYVTVEDCRISGSQNYGISVDGGTVISHRNRMESNKKGDVVERRAGRVGS